jgi:AraC-like DNA-binding protein
MALSLTDNGIPDGPALSHRDLLGLAVSREPSVMGDPLPNQPWEAGVGVRLRPVGGTGPDFRDVVRAGAGLYVVASDRENRSERATKMITDQSLVFEFRISGASISAFENRGRFSLQGPSVHVKTYPAGMAEAEWFSTSERVRHIALAICPSYLDEVLDLSASSLPEPLRTFASGAPTDFFLQQMGMSSEMLLAAKRLLDCDFHGQIKRTYTEAKAIELQCLAFDAFVGSLNTSSLSVRLSARDHARLGEVRAFLDDQDTMPSVHSLVRMFCLNRNKISYGFKHRFGVSLSDYFRERQMERALDLVRNSDLSLGEIAYRVGYTHQTNFTSAFKARFGLPPKDFRRR